eukprot:202408-Chlamydomonas_euryale.AAC.4
MLLLWQSLQTAWQHCSSVWVQCGWPMAADLIPMWECHLRESTTSLIFYITCGSVKRGTRDVLTCNGDTSSRIMDPWGPVSGAHVRCITPSYPK